MSAPMQVFQYVDPRDSDDDTNTKWIAAANKQIADSVATLRGWREHGGRIFETLHAGAPDWPRNEQEWRDLGCDVVIMAEAK